MVPGAIKACCSAAARQGSVGICRMLLALLPFLLHAQLVDKNPPRTSCSAGSSVPAPVPCKDPPPAPGKEILGELAKAGWRCADGQDSCSGNFPVSVGSGGTGVEAFYTLRRDAKAQAVIVAWSCPRPDDTVVVELFVDVRTFQWKGKCGLENTGNAFGLPQFRNLSDGLMLARIRLVTQVGCTLPTYLLAQVTVPPGHFGKSEHYCTKSMSSSCLVMRSTFGSPYGWEINVGEEKRIGSGKIDSVGIALAAPNRCFYVPVYAEFRSKDGRSGMGDKALIGELWF
jgi:hypothetical protein